MYIYVYVCLNNQVACTKYKNLHKFERKCKLLYESVGGREIVFFKHGKIAYLSFAPFSITKWHHQRNIVTKRLNDVKNFETQKNWKKKFYSKKRENGDYGKKSAWVYGFWVFSYHFQCVQNMHSIRFQTSVDH